MRKYKRYISVFLIFILTTAFFVQVNRLKVKGDNINDNSTIYVYLTMYNTGSTTLHSFNFSLTGNYLYSDGSSYINLDSSPNYNLSIQNGVLTLKKSGTTIASTSSNIRIEPLNMSSTAVFNKPAENSTTRAFKGSLIIKIKSAASFQVINKLNIEDYVEGVVPYEVSDSYPAEALKAQAVAARTYALYQKVNSNNYNTYGYDIGDGTQYQVYNGYDAGAANANNAVEATKGEILTYNGSLIETFFSADNGGYTEKVGNVWNDSSAYPYLTVQADTYDTDSHTQYLTVDALNKKINALSSLNLPDNSVSDSSIDSIKTFVQDDPSNKSPRVKYINLSYTVNGTKKTISVGKGYLGGTADYIRSFLGLDSDLFTITSFNNGQYSFNVKGYGHGLGMSQIGAKKRALDNYKYTDILSFYYNNTAIKKLDTQIAEFGSSIGGEDRYETALKLAQASYPDTFNNVILASGENFPDALSAAPLAKKLDAPILFVNKSPDSTVSQNTLNYVISKLNKGGTIYILGGTDIISSEFENIFTSGIYKNNGYIIKRIDGKDYGSDRYATNIDIIKNLDYNDVPLIVTTGKVFPDAISASSVAAANSWPILLVGDELSQSEETAIKEMNPSKIYIIGGTSAVSDQIKDQLKTDLNLGDDNVLRLYGNNRYETNYAVNKYFAQTPEYVLVTSGKNYPDALAGSVYSYKNSAPIVLTDDNSFYSSKLYLQNNYESGVLTKVIPLGKIFDEDYNLINILSYSD